MEAGYWSELFKELAAGVIDTWDYQINVLSWKHSFVHIYPAKCTSEICPLPEYRFASPKLMHALTKPQVPWQES